MSEAIPFNKVMDATPGVATEVVPGVRRILANNPGPMTFTGTNTYLVGFREVAVIDPGHEDEGHRQAILAAAAEGGGRVTHILLTHTHRDHCAGLDGLKAASGATTYGFGPATLRRAAAARHAEARSFLDTDFRPDVTLADGDTVDGGAWRLSALHTPGHAPDHLCFALEGAPLLFSGDHVMGWNTSVIAPPEGHMGDYMTSLERLLARRDDLFLSGHGEIIKEPQRLVKAFIVHRQWREAAILECVRDGVETVNGVRSRIYGNVDASVASAAALSALAHLESLVERRLVSCQGSPTLQSRFHPVR